MQGVPRGEREKGGGGVGEEEEEEEEEEEGGFCQLRDRMIQ